jgi:hypothetical protein
MVTSAKGTFYAPSPPPQSGGEAELRQWCNREFGRIATAIRTGRAEYLSMDKLPKIPPRPFEGQAVYFAADVVGPGTAEGFYEFDGSTWHKL